MFSRWASCSSAPATTPPSGPCSSARWSPGPCPTWPRWSGPAGPIVGTVYAVGSAGAGLAFGALGLTTPLPRLLLLSTAGTALTTFPLLLVSDLATLSAAVFFSGLFFAPTMIVVMGLVERTVPPAALTEGMTWAITGLSVGVALGASLSGGMVDRFGPSGGFAVAIAAGGATVLLALTAQRPLGRSLREPADEGHAKAAP
ncbi:MFS transporter [Streptomyces sp. NPDC057552]|uniref:MFS transporter n=1 Tax=Streptomyces sp. NPDC057552 TaxID=3350537 RepID=UPI0036B6433F